MGVVSHQEWHPRYRHTQWVAQSAESTRRLQRWMARRGARAEELRRNVVSTRKGTMMATVAITPDQDAVVAEIFVAAPPSRVFEAITDPKQVPQWWGQQGMYRITEWLSLIHISEPTRLLS